MNWCKMNTGKKGMLKMISKDKTRITVTIDNENASFLDFVSLNLQDSKSNIINALVSQWKNWYLGTGEKNS